MWKDTKRAVNGDLEVPKHTYKHLVRGGTEEVLEEVQAGQAQTSELMEHTGQSKVEEWLVVL
jgi:hypothetical protein